MPQLSRVGVLYNPTVPYTTGEVVDLAAAARTLGLSLLRLEVREPKDLETAFANLAQSRASALFTVSDLLTYVQRQRIADLAVVHRLPGMFGFREYAKATQVVPCAPWQIDPAVLDTDAVRRAANAVEGRTLRPRSHGADSQTLEIPGL